MVVFPRVRMITDFDCGPACITAMYLWHDQIPPQDVMRLVDTSGMTGGVEGMKDALGHLGSVEETHHKLPATCLIWSNMEEPSCEHWVILLHTSQASAWYMDPEDGEVHCVPLALWDALWSDERLSSRCLGLYCDPHNTIQCHDAA